MIDYEDPSSRAGFAYPSSITEPHQRRKSVIEEIGRSLFRECKKIYLDNQRRRKNLCSEVTERGLIKR